MKNLEDNQPKLTKTNLSDRKSKRPILIWILAVLITLSAAGYQRLVGPTRPVRGKITIADQNISYKLAKSHGGETNHTVSIKTPDEAVDGTLLYKRYKTSDPVVASPMVWADGALTGQIPRQPQGGKVAYRVLLTAAPGNIQLAPEDLFQAVNPPETEAGQTALLPDDNPITVRFRGGVPPLVMIPHIIFIFIGMLWSNRAGFEFFRLNGNPLKHGLIALIFLTLGGLIFGPAVQWHSFGEAWTGFPVGYDLTDNKTLIAVLAWIAALLLGRRSPAGARWWVLGAAFVTLAIFLVPHSVLGTELDYSTLPESGAATNP